MQPQSASAEIICCVPEPGFFNSMYTRSLTPTDRELRMTFLSLSSNERAAGCFEKHKKIHNINAITETLAKNMASRTRGAKCIHLEFGVVPNAVCESTSSIVSTDFKSRVNSEAGRLFKSMFLTS